VECRRDGALRPLRVSEIETLKMLPSGMITEHMNHTMAYKTLANSLNGAIVDWIVIRLRFSREKHAGGKRERA
jgi:hypothetical protein